MIHHRSASSRFARQLLAAAALMAIGASLGGLPPAAAAPSSVAANPAPAWAPGRLLLAPRAGVSEAALSRLMQSHGGQARRLGRSPLRVLQLPAGVSETAVLQRLSGHPLLKFVELDRKVDPSTLANDPYAGNEWHLSRIRADLAWDMAQGTGTTIAVLDSGVNANHEDLRDQLVPGWNTATVGGDLSDNTGHGTAVIGTAAASLNNGLGVAGVAGAANVMSIRITDDTGTAYYSTVASGVIYAADAGVKVVSCSYGGLFKDSSVKNAGSYLKSLGGLLVVPAGNNNMDETTAPTDKMIVVSGTDSSDRRASFSSWGNMVDVAAPATGIWTTDRNGGYKAANGTSFATPIVAAVLSLMWSANPSLSAGQVESLLYDTAVDLGSVGQDNIYGHGRVDAAAAVEAALATPIVDQQAPTAQITSPSGGSTQSGAVAIDVNASDNVGVARVELRVDGSLVATDTVAPYQFSWDSTKAANGSHRLAAVAYDAAGNQASSADVAINVNNGTAPDTTPPVVTFLSPQSGSTLSKNTMVKLSASDDGDESAIRQSLYIDGTLVATSTGTTLRFGWSTRRAAAGTYTLTGVAVDAAGNSSSTSITVSR